MVRHSFLCLTNGVPESVYEGAVRAGLRIGDSEFEGSVPYYRDDSKLVRRHIEKHGEF